MRCAGPITTPPVLLRSTWLQTACRGNMGVTGVSKCELNRTPASIAQRAGLILAARSGPIKIAA